MAYCPFCGSEFHIGETRCAKCGEALPRLDQQRAAEPSVSAQTEHKRAVIDTSRWTTFRCWDDSFSLRHPAELRDVHPPKSEGASLSCEGPHGSPLLEAFGLRNVGYDKDNDPMASTIADGIVETLGLETGHTNARLVRREQLSFRNATQCERVLVSYSDRGLLTTTDYFVVSMGRDAIILALKILSSEYEKYRVIFDQIIETLAAPWLASKSPQSDVSRMPPAETIAATQQPAEAEARPSKGIDATAPDETRTRCYRVLSDFFHVSVKELEGDPMLRDLMQERLDLAEDDFDDESGFDVEEGLIVDELMIELEDEFHISLLEVDSNRLLFVDDVVHAVQNALTNVSSDSRGSDIHDGGRFDDEGVDDLDERLSPQEYGFAKPQDLAFAKQYAQLHPMYPELPDREQSKGPNGTGKCFIATAACGTDQAEDVVKLREFRDAVLRGTNLGRAFVAIYETISPPIARLVARSEWARWLVRSLVIHPLRVLAERWL